MVKRMPVCERLQDEQNNLLTASDQMMRNMKNSEGIKVRGRIKLNEPMARHTSWRAGGHAKRYFEPYDLEDLCHFLRAISPDEAILMAGLGSNLLVRDGGFNGTVIVLGKPFGEIRLGSTPHRIHVGGGAPCAKVARFSVKNKLANAEFLAGIPGTMGGALAMNAGAFGSETWDIVESLVTVDRRGQVHTRKPDEYKVGYRHITAPGEEWFVSAVLILEPDRTGRATQAVKALLNQRSQTQPIGLPSCGSVFRNPKGDHAARLIEAAGLKGKCIGDACISDKHANFIINMGNATAADIEQLLMHIKNCVASEFSIELEPEVKIVGDRIE